MSVGWVPARVCDLEENTPPRLPRRTEEEGEGGREGELAQGQWEAWGSFEVSLLELDGAENQ